MIAPIARAEDTPSADQVVLRVGQTEITLGHIIQTREALPPQYQSYPDNVLLEGIVDQLLRQTVLAASGDQAEDTRIRVTLENERRALFADRVIAVIAAEAITDEKVQAVYDRDFANAPGAPEFDASHILVDTEAEAQALVDQLNAGADFADLAKAHSTGPSGPSGGALGWFGEGQMVPEFETAVKALEKGGVSAPVKTQFGWHVVRLNDTRTAATPTLDEVRAQIENDLQSQAVNAAMDAMVEAADVDRSGLDGLDPALIRASDLLK